MKVNLIRRYKWYIFGAIAVVLIMSIGLSFCSWDSISLKNLSVNGGVANYKPYDLVVDNNNNGMADVGDIVTYGRYYQQAIATTKDPIRWIVVHKENNELTLLSEKVLSFGSFWNRFYADKNGVRNWEDLSFAQYYQNYMVSTLNMWLNSDYGARHDKGNSFNPNADKIAMRGFMNEAFNSDQINYINPKKISGIQGYAQGNANTGLSTYGSGEYKVWVPSWSEIYGTSLTSWGETSDGLPNKQFDLFKGADSIVRNEYLLGTPTAFALNTSKSNYTTSADTSHINNAQGKTINETVWWWLRSPSGTEYNNALIINGIGSASGVPHSHGGVRPAIYINA